MSLCSATTASTLDPNNFYYHVQGSIVSNNNSFSFHIVCDEDLFRVIHKMTSNSHIQDESS